MLLHVGPMGCSVDVTMGHGPARNQVFFFLKLVIRLLGCYD